MAKPAFLGITPCCGRVITPSKKLIAETRSKLKLGICPTCNTDLVEPPSPSDHITVFRAKLWFRNNAWRSQAGAWQWCDSDAEAFRNLVSELAEENPPESKCAAFDVYTMMIVVVVEPGDHQGLLAVKQAGGEEFRETWRVPVTPDCPTLIGKLRELGYTVMPSVARGIDAMAGHWGI